MSAFSSIGKRDFTAKTNRALAARGVEILGLAMSGEVYCATRHYSIVDNGCGRILSFSEVLELAA